MEIKRFHEVIQAAMSEKGLKGGTLARRCGTGKGYISGIRRGKCAPPTAKFVRRLAKALDLDFHQLLITAELEKVDIEVRELMRKAIEIGLDRILPQGVDPKKEPAAVAG